MKTLLAVAVGLLLAGCAGMPQGQIAFDPANNYLALTVANGTDLGHVQIIRSNDLVLLSFAPPATNATRAVRSSPPKQTIVARTLAK